MGGMVPQDSQLTGLETDTTRQDTAVQPRSILATYLVNRFRLCEMQKRVTSDREPESSAVSLGFFQPQIWEAAETCDVFFLVIKPVDGCLAPRWSLNIETGDGG